MDLKWKDIELSHLVEYHSELMQGFKSFVIKHSDEIHFLIENYGYSGNDGWTTFNQFDETRADDFDGGILIDHGLACSELMNLF